MEVKTFEFKKLRIRVELHPRSYQDLDFEDGELLLEKEWASIYLGEQKRFYPRDKIVAISLEG